MCLCVFVCVKMQYHLYPSVSGCLSYFHIFAIINNTTMNVGIHASFRFFFLDKYPEVELLDHMLVLFLVFFFRLLHTIFHSGCTTLHSHQQYMRILFPSHSLQHTSCFYLLIIAILGNEVIHHCGFDLHFPSN